MTDPSATYISPNRRKPVVNVPVCLQGRDGYNLPGVKYPACNPAAKLKLNKLCADIALDYCNNKNDTKFEFVDETFNSYSVGDPSGIWIDCCFNAKDDSSIKHFSAEIQYLHQSGLDLSYFKILEGETEVGCANCTHASPAMSKKEGRNVDREIVENVKDPKRRKTILEQEVVPVYLGDENQLGLKTISDQKVAPVSLDIGDENQLQLKTISDQKLAPVSLKFGDENQLQLKTLANPAAQLKFNKLCADIALDCYNREDNTKFELAATEPFDSFTVSTMWGISISCCFYAKDDPSIKHFNAYLHYSHESGPSVISCVILEGKIERRGYCTHACTVDRASVENPADPENYPDDGLFFNWKRIPGDCYTFNPASPDYEPSSPKYKPAMTG